MAYALRRYYENGFADYFDLIKPAFDASGGVVHGLVHSIAAGEQCVCYACSNKGAA